MKRTELKRKTPLKKKRDNPRRVLTQPGARKRIQKGPARHFKAHRDWIETFPCHRCRTTAERRWACHLRWHTDGGEGLKPTDAWTWPGCAGCHGRQHQIGEPAFWDGENPWLICWEYAHQSPIEAIRDYATGRMEYRFFGMEPTS